MKTKLSILLLFVVAAISAVSAQRVRPAGYESVYFDREDYIPAEGDTIIYLYEKGGGSFFRSREIWENCLDLEKWARTYSFFSKENFRI